MAYEHLRLEREEPLRDRHRRQDKRPRFKPADPRAHGAALAGRLDQARQRAMAEDIGGFDDRKLLKIRLRAGDKSVPAFDAIPGVEIVSQEDESIVLAFATDDGLREFESRLATLARDGVVTQGAVLRHRRLRPLDNQDRTGAALLEQGFPATPTFMLDVELWPQERQDKRQEMVRAFLDWLHAQGIERLDDIQQPSLVMVRVRCNRAQVSNSAPSRCAHC